MSLKLWFSIVLWSASGVSASLAQECGRPLTQTRTSGGMNVTAGAWPWHVDIQRGRGHIRGGSIVSEDWVLSAAHCFSSDPDDWGRYVVYAGRLQQKGNNPYESSHRVSYVVVAPGYVTPFGGKDVALAKLSTPVQWSDHIRPVCLPSAGILFPVGMTCYVTGWGYIRDIGPETESNTLQEVEVPIISQSSCEVAYQADSKFDILDDMICTEHQRSSSKSCQGDFGGPLVCQMVSGTWVQAGVVSFSEDCTRQNKVVIYARLTTFTDFIKSTISTIRLHSRAPAPLLMGSSVFLSCLSSLLMLLQR